MKNKNTNKEKGFTLIELLVVIAIIALLSGIVLASLSSSRERAIVTNLRSNLSSLRTNAEIIRVEKRTYNSQFIGSFTLTDDDCWTSGSDTMEFLVNGGLNQKVMDELRKSMITGFTAKCVANNDIYVFAFTVKPELARLFNNNKTICVDSTGRINFTNDNANTLTLSGNSCQNI